METPKNKAGKLTEELMAEISDHILGNDAGFSHYNRVYEAVYRMLAKLTEASK